jgi:hypothetical protein
VLTSEWDSFENHSHNLQPREFPTRKIRPQSRLAVPGLHTGAMAPRHSVRKILLLPPTVAAVPAERQCNAESVRWQGKRPHLCSSGSPENQAIAEARGWSFTYLAIHSGVAKSTLLELEKGRTEPSSERATAFKISLNHGNQEFGVAKILQNELAFSSDHRL